MTFDDALDAIVEKNRQVADLETENRALKNELAAWMEWAKFQKWKGIHLHKVGKKVPWPQREVEVDEYIELTRAEWLAEATDGKPLHVALEEDYQTRKRDRERANEKGITLHELYKQEGAFKFLQL